MFIIIVFFVSEYHHKDQEMFNDMDVMNMQLQAKHYYTLINILFRLGVVNFNILFSFSIFWFTLILPSSQPFLMYMHVDP